MTTRDIEARLAEVYGASVSRELISNITEVVVDEIKAWQSRPLDEDYPILYIDGLRRRIGANGVITTNLSGDRGGPGGPQTRAGGLDSRQRGCQVLAERRHRPE